MKLSARGVAMAAGILLLLGAALPASAHAATVDVRTAQVLPPGGASCSSLPVQNIVPYLQDGVLQSFDLIIGDSSYVSLLASVGETSVPFNYMTRWGQSDGTLKIHVDVPSTPVYGSLPVQVTLLSSPSGRPTCLATVSFSVLGNAQPPQSTQHTAPTGETAAPNTPADTGTQGAQTEATSTASSTGSTSVTSPVVSGSLQRNLERACTVSGAFQLWFVLLALFVVIAIITAIAQPPLAERSPALPLAAILIPLALLMAFWYFAPLCRAASWIPVILIVAAILGLLGAFRDREELARVIQLPPAKS